MTKEKKERITVIVQNLKQMDIVRADRKLRNRAHKKK